MAPMSRPCARSIVSDSTPRNISDWFNRSCKASTWALERGERAHVFGGGARSDNAPGRPGAGTTSISVSLIVGGGVSRASGPMVLVSKKTQCALGSMTRLSQSGASANAPLGGRSSRRLARNASVPHFNFPSYVSALGN